MASSNTTASVPQLPNPHTPMAFLPPELAYQVTIAMYILIGSLGVSDFSAHDFRLTDP